MCRSFLPSAAALLLFFAGPLAAADVAQLERRIAKEPDYQSRPKYCLLAFTREGDRRVWLVHDGNTLYVDRNGNGDLTEPGERIAADSDDRYALTFQAGEVRPANRTHARLQIVVMKLERMAYQDEQAKKRSEQDPEALHYRVKLDVDLPGRFGQGIGGRVEHDVWRDAKGFLEFADAARRAPIIDFEGSWQITLFKPPRLMIGRSTELFLAIGAPGIGAGTTAYVGYEGVIPDGMRPQAEISYMPQTADGPPIHQRYQLKHRCCAINFHDAVHVPENAGVGAATIELSFNSWKGEAAPSRHEVEVMPPPRGPKAEPVSTRLKTALLHPRQKGLISMIAYSADGKRIAASDSLSGAIQIWDADTGKEVVTIETGERALGPELAATPDWRTVFSSRWSAEERVGLERDGKKLFRFKFSGDVRAWNVGAGEVRQTFQHSPPRAITAMLLAPDGLSFVTFELLSGETEGAPTTAASLWDVRTGVPRALPDGLGLYGTTVYSPDGQTLVVQTENEKHMLDAVKLIDVPTGRVRLSIPITEKEAQRVGFIAFSPDGKRLVGQVRDETKSGRHWLKFWDPATGREVASFAGEKKAFFLWMTFSADSRLLAVSNVGQGPKGRQLFLFDVTTGSLLRTIPLGKAAWNNVISPDGKWIALPVQDVPENQNTLRSSPEEVAQPRIHLIDASTGDICETIISPPAFPRAVRFSPDGKTLATGGDGRVLLWDLASPPLGDSDDDR